jgi:hypothetical protein
MMDDADADSAYAEEPEPETEDDFPEPTGRGRRGAYRKPPPLEDHQLALRNSLIEGAAKAVFNEKKMNNGRLPYGYMTKVITELQAFPLTAHVKRDHINHLVQKMERTQPEDADADAEDAAAAAVLITPVNKAGRPKGSTVAAKRKQETLHQDACTWASKQLLQLKADAKAKDVKLAPGTLKSIVKQANIKFRLDDKHLVKQETIKTRVRRGNPTGRMKTPMELIEPLLVGFCIRASRIGEPLNREVFLDLANSLIEGTPTQEKVEQWKAKIKAAKNKLGNGYYSAFMKRNQEHIKRGRGYKKDTNRVLWGTYQNLLHMYDKIYALLEEVGHAIKLDLPVWMNKQGQIVDSQGSAFGMQVELELTHPERVCFCW